jgi:hypothetical protein
MRITIFPTARRRESKIPPERIYNLVCLAGLSMGTSLIFPGQFPESREIVPGTWCSDHVLACGYFVLHSLLHDSNPRDFTIRAACICFRRREKFPAYVTPDFRLHPIIFSNVLILYGLNPFDAAGDFTRLIDGFLRSNEPAQLNRAFKGFHTDLERLESFLSTFLVLIFNLSETFDVCSFDFVSGFEFRAWYLVATMPLRKHMNQDSKWLR